MHAEHPGIRSAVVISFCIPAHDEERLLPATLASIHGAAGALSLDYEIIVADDASTDATPVIAVAAGARVVPIDRRQIAAARNAAGSAARGEALFFVDADTLVHAAALRQALDLLDSGCVGGGAVPRFEGRVPLWAAVMVEVLVVIFRVTRFTAGAFMFCTADAFRRSGGFDEALYGAEELYFALALKRVGLFRLIGDRVVTSGRKLRAYSFAEVMHVVFRAGLKGRRGACTREGLEIWYGPRRDDPADQVVRNSK